jgi:hypothetical protein
MKRKIQYDSLELNWLKVGVMSDTSNLFLRQMIPINGLLALYLQEVIALREVFASNEATVCGQRGWMHRH